MQNGEESLSRATMYRGCSSSREAVHQRKLVKLQDDTVNSDGLHGVFWKPMTFASDVPDSRVQTITWRLYAELFRGRIFIGRQMRLCWWVHLYSSFCESCGRPRLYFKSRRRYVYMAVKSWFLEMIVVGMEVSHLTYHEWFSPFQNLSRTR